MGDESDRVVFYELNLEHAMSEANMQVSNSSHVDIYGLKVEGSNVILWISDSNDVHLSGLGGGADAFPSKSYLPNDFAGYEPSIIRVERSTRFKLINLCDGGRGNEAHPIKPIGSFPLTSSVVLKYPWPDEEVPKIIKSMWA